MWSPENRNITSFAHIMESPIKLHLILIQSISLWGAKCKLSKKLKFGNENTIDKRMPRIRNL